MGILPALSAAVVLESLTNPGQGRVEPWHGETVTDGRTLASDRAAAPRRAAQAPGRAAARVQSGGAHRHPVRTPHGHSVGDVAAGTGLRERDDLLAPAAGLAG